MAWFRRRVRRRRERRRWCWTSTARCTRSTPRTSRRRRRPTRAASGSTRCTASPTPPARPSPCVRPGNAGANNIADHVAVLDGAIAGLPTEIAAGHRPSDDAALVNRPVQVRTDSAGCTDFVWHARNRNVGFAVVARSNAPSMRPSAAFASTRTTGSLACAKTATSAQGRRWPRSASWSTCQRGRRAPG